MQKHKTFNNVQFTPEVIKEAEKKMSECFPDKHKIECRTDIRSIKITDSEKWDYDTDEEFFADMRKPHSFFYWRHYVNDLITEIMYFKDQCRTHVSVTASTRQKIESVFDAFERNVDACRLPELPTPPDPPDPPKPNPCVFVGHGRSGQWRDLKDHLHEKHGYDVEAYEIGARAGHAIRDILEDMLTKSLFAILVMTGEDKDEDGNMRARQNIIHELGLFQGRLGFSKAVILLEEGTEEFSNIYGIQQIRYKKDNIKETFGEVLATLRQEFGG